MFRRLGPIANPQVRSFFIFIVLSFQASIPRFASIPTIRNLDYLSSVFVDFFVHMFNFRSAAQFLNANL